MSIKTHDVPFELQISPKNKMVSGLQEPCENEMESLCKKSGFQESDEKKMESGLQKLGEKMGSGLQAPSKSELVSRQTAFVHI